VPETDNDGRFPDGSAVETRFPLKAAPVRGGERGTWPWLLATVECQCGPDEWLVTIEDRRAAELADGAPAPEGTPDEDLLFPQCYRESSEIRKPQGDPDAS
jgi:hypothetical protein